MCLHEGKGRGYPTSVQNACTIKVNSRICIKDVDSGEVFTFCLVPPDELDAKNGKISVLTSLGAALIGKGVGNVITWQAPSCLRRFRVQSVV
jgi:regulator of nucleoside diphosphate kinase